MNKFVRVERVARGGVLHAAHATIPGQIVSMPILRQREGSDAPDPRWGRARDAAPRPIVLATLSVRVDPDAERMAIESALETGAKLIIANMLWLPPHPTTSNARPRGRDPAPRGGSRRRAGDRRAGGGPGCSNTYL